MSDHEVSFPTVLGDTVRIRAMRERADELSHAERVRALVAAREIRLGLSWHSEAVLQAALDLRALLGQGRSSEFRRFDPSLEIRGFLDDLAATLEFALESGRLVVVDGAEPLLDIPPEVELVVRKFELDIEPSLPPIARRPREGVLTFFEVRFVDEIGQAISGLEVELRAGSRIETASTNGSGMVTLEDVTESSASVSVVDAKALGEIVEPRWETPRAGALPKGPNTKLFAFTGDDIKSVALKPAVPNTVVITPPLGKLFVELWDKTGRVRHVQQKYSITGPQSFSGTTDDEGRLLHELVARGDYELTLTVEIEGGNGEIISDTYKSPLVALEMSETAPQLRMVGAVPRVVMARMRGMLFDKDKCFLLPTAAEALRELRKIYEANNPSELLIVGHTDTTGEPSANETLSKERADSVKAYLMDDVDAWLANYDLAEKKKWGSREDRLMVSAMPDFATRGESEDIIEWFQRTRRLEVDGKAGKETRTQLIQEYMALDGIALAESPGFVLSIETHGAGENFPLADTGFELDQNAADGKDDAFDRRVELFFFDPEFKVLPKPGSPAGPEYLEWRKRAARNDDFPVAGAGKVATVVELPDTLFRTNSCVVLPQGEAPSADGHGSATSAGLFATALRFNEELPQKKLFIAGHTDSVDTPEFNQKLSEERAKCALALLEGKRDDFVTLVKARHKVSDYKQILSWCTATFPELFDCDPGKIDDNVATGSAAVENFQIGYNANASALGAAGGIGEDGIVGDETWGAFFDVYQFAIREELGEEAAGVDALRAKLVFVDDARKALGFGEHHAVDQVGRDNVQSQTNRRVELLFFESGEEPDLVLAESDPDVSDLYLPGSFAHATLSFDDVDIFACQLFRQSGEPLADTAFTIVEAGSGMTDAEGIARFHLPAGLERFTIEWVDETSIRRELVLTADDADALRLHNLGYEADTVAAQLRQYRLDFERSNDVPDDDAIAEVRAWHDKGEVPERPESEAS
ncbi:MAG TPA: OmpA family protein [Polyangiaceae bacterium]|nr:OmpA family protein [Polyangiaceae bacterium]